MTRLLRKKKTSEHRLPTTLFDQHTVSDSPAPFDEVGITPKSLRERGDYYTDELDDLETGHMNPENPNVDPEA